ncbi:34128_t:CDS:2, partial [Racocetra persica]
EEYEKKVKTISLENNISDQMARTQIYDEMSQKLIGMNNCEHAYNLPATESQIFDSKTKILSETKISMPVKPQASDASSNLKTES